MEDLRKASINKSLSKNQNHIGGHLYAQIICIDYSYATFPWVAFGAISGFR